MDSLFVRLGGEGAVAAVVDMFYDTMLKDERLMPFFEGVDDRRLRRMQVRLSLRPPLRTPTDRQLTSHYRARRVVHAVGRSRRA
jgi:hypothetical protein